MTIEEIYKDNGTAAPEVGEFNPHFAGNFKQLECGCWFVEKSHTISQSAWCEKHCDNHYGFNCHHAHGKKMEVTSQDAGTMTIFTTKWVDYEG